MGWPTLGGQFMPGDDQRFVTEHFLVRHASWSHAWELLTIVHDDLRQPLPMLSFMVDAIRAADPMARPFGLSPRPFHQTNVGLHVINSVLAYLFLRRMLGAHGTALLAGMLFATHPFAVETVAWVSGRMMLLATTFALAAMLLCLMPREPGRTTLLAATAVWLCSLLSKVLPTAPVAMALIDRTARGRWFRPTTTAAACMLALAVVVSAEQWTRTRSAGFDAGAGEESQVTAPLHLLLAGGFYLRNYLVPLEPAAWHPPLTEGPTAADVMTSVACMLILAGAFIWGRRCEPRAALGIAVFAILLAPFLAATLSRRMLAADRYMYLPILGLHAAMAVLAARATAAVFRRRAGAARLFFGAVSATLCAGALWRSTQLAAGYADSVTAYQRVVETYPDNALAYAELAKACNFTGDYARALRVVDQARGRWPQHPRLALEAGEALWRSQGPAAGLADLSRAAEAMPRHIGAQSRLAGALSALGHFDRAAAVYQRILDELQPDHVPSLTGLGLARLRLGDAAAARRAFEAAVAINPRHRDCLFQLGTMSLSQGAFVEAAERYEQILMHDADDAPARFNLAVALANQGQYAAALAEYDHLSEQHADDAGLAVNRSQCLAALNRHAEALATLAGYFDRHPQNLAVAARLHLLYVDQGKAAELPGLWLRYASAGGTPHAQAFLTWALALAGDLDAARKALGRCSEEDGEADFARWALVHAALRDDDDVSLQSLLASLPARGRTDVRTDEHASILRQALGRLGLERKMAPRSACVLIRLSLYFGEDELARRQFAWLRDQAPPRDPWRLLAEEAIAAIDRDLATRPAD